MTDCGAFTALKQLSDPQPPTHEVCDCVEGTCGVHGACTEGCCVCDEGYSGNSCEVDSMGRLVEARVDPVCSEVKINNLLTLVRALASLTLGRAITRVIVSAHNDVSVLPLR